MDEVKNINEQLETAREKAVKEEIKNKSESLEIEYDLLTKKVQEYLYRIECIISDKAAIKKEGLNMIKNATFNLNSIADTMKISRTTLYNNKTLELYIKHSKKIFEQDNPYTEIDILKTYIRELENQVNDLINRDIEFELIKQQVMGLNMELSKKEKAYKELLERRNILSAENTKLIAELRELKKTVKKEADKSVCKVRPLNKDND
jgi:hypothetical protein